MPTTWEFKEQRGATRMICDVCGAHTLSMVASRASCNCCLSTHLRPITPIRRADRPPR